MLFTIGLPGALSKFDSPATTSPVTYKIRFYKSGAGLTQLIMRNINLTLMEILP